MELKRVLEESTSCIMNTYKRFPVIFVKGRGMSLWSKDGKEYIDFLSGIAVNVLGHCHPKVVVAIQKQVQRLGHISNFYHNDVQVKLAKILIKRTFAERVFFSNSGAEANEAAIKLARKYSTTKYGTDRYEIITALNSFHGRTLATLTATGQSRLHKGFEPLVPGFKYVAFDNFEAMKHTISEKTCAIMLEPVQGEGGVRIATEGYFKNIRELCTQNGILLILDEIQTGMGRTGTLFAYEQFGIEPDILTSAKALGGGMPIGATLATEEVASAFDVGSHGSTFGGNPIVAAASIATIETILEDGILLQECTRLGEYFIDSLMKLKKDFKDIVVNVRGMGLLVGLELNRECSQVVQACFERGFLINCTSNNVLRFCPPLIVTQEHIDRLMVVLREVLERLS
ncbi:MAG: acetylornithine transaminase [Candidatus Magnetoovum sp. WYHC-5]|nr:acetylornithine transaminase [Candidatus Magnetoovum sp. WYHC-5]